MHTLTPLDVPVQITNSILNRKTMQSLSKDMDQWIDKRDALSRKREDLLKQREVALKAKVHMFSHLCQKVTWGM